MAIAALILGIIAFIVSFIPGCGLIIGVLPAIIGIILGIVALAKKKQRKAMAITGLILSALALLIMLIMMLVFSLGLSIYDTASNSIMEEANTMISDFSSIVEDDEETTTKYNVGEIHEDEDVDIKYVSKDEDFKGYRSYATIEEGYKIIKVEFEFENTSSSNKYVSSYDFDCYADGYDCDSFYSVENSTFGTTLAPGKKTKGAAYFEVPQNATEITVEYEDNGDRAVFIVK